MKVNIKRLHPDAVIPQYAHASDAGLDLTAVGVETDSNGNIVYHTGLSFEIPAGFVGLVFPRSSNAKKDVYLTNSVGVIDSGYRGEVSFKFRPVNGKESKIYEKGDRVGQIIIMPYPIIELCEVSELSEGERGVNSYGSTGK